MTSEQHDEPTPAAAAPAGAAPNAGAEPPMIKLCGLRGTDDARAAVLAGADLVGIVLVPGTRRYVPPPTATAMVRTIRDTAAEAGRFTPEIVGLVGQMSLAVATQLVTSTGIDSVQLVGSDEDCLRIADVLAPDTPIIRTIAVGEDSHVDALRAQVEMWEQRGARIVFDAKVDGELGGTGHRIAGDLVRPLLSGARRGLAGGLTPDNVAAVIRDLQPAMVDVSSGIESHAGHKDPELMRAFVAAARAASIDDIDLDSLHELAAAPHERAAAHDLGAAPQAHDASGATSSSSSPPAPDPTEPT
ncbi:MAG: phosphoribosylanthranilate isomerase [Thermoleophilia bacterium]|nr:phosphoribosylanthranilate isomerase [Thermoleophilia bacterium]